MGLSLLNTCLTLGAVIIVGALAALGRSTLMGMSGERIIARLRKQAYGSVMHQEIQFTDTKAGNIVSRLSCVLRFALSSLFERCLIQPLVCARAPTEMTPTFLASRSPTTSRRASRAS